VQFSLPGHFFSRLDLAVPLTHRDASNGRHTQYYFRLGINF
jgi:hemolysin activation/secretion protein